MAPYSIVESSGGIAPNPDVVENTTLAVAGTIDRAVEDGLLNEGRLNKGVAILRSILSKERAGGKIFIYHSEIQAKINEFERNNDPQLVKECESMAGILIDSGIIHVFELLQTGDELTNWDDHDKDTIAKLGFGLDLYFTRIKRQAKKLGINIIPEETPQNEQGIGHNEITPKSMEELVGLIAQVLAESGNEKTGGLPRYSAGMVEIIKNQYSEIQRLWYRKIGQKLIPPGTILDGDDFGNDGKQLTETAENKFAELAFAMRNLIVMNSGLDRYIEFINSTKTILSLDKIDTLRSTLEAINQIAQMDKNSLEDKRYEIMEQYGAALNQGFNIESLFQAQVPIPILIRKETDPNSYIQENLWLSVGEYIDFLYGMEKECVDSEKTKVYRTEIKRGKTFSLPDLVSKDNAQPGLLRREDSRRFFLAERTIAYQIKTEKGIKTLTWEELSENERKRALDNTDDSITEIKLYRSYDFYGTGANEEKKFSENYLTSKEIDRKVYQSDESYVLDRVRHYTVTDSQGNKAIKTWNELSSEEKIAIGSSFILNGETITVSSAQKIYRLADGSLKSEANLTDQEKNSTTEETRYSVHQIKELHQTEYDQLQDGSEEKTNAVEVREDTEYKIEIPGRQGTFLMSQLSEQERANIISGKTKFKFVFKEGYSPEEIIRTRPGEYFYTLSSEMKKNTISLMVVPYIKRKLESMGINPNDVIGVAEKGASGEYLFPATDQLMAGLQSIIDQHGVINLSELNSEEIRNLGYLQNINGKFIDSDGNELRDNEEKNRVPTLYQLYPELKTVIQDLIYKGINLNSEKARKIVSESILAITAISSSKLWQTANSWLAISSYDIGMSARKWEDISEFNIKGLHYGEYTEKYGIGYVVQRELPGSYISALEGMKIESTDPLIIASNYKLSNDDPNPNTIQISEARPAWVDPQEKRKSVIAPIRFARHMLDYIKTALNLNNSQELLWQRTTKLIEAIGFAYSPNRNTGNQRFNELLHNLMNIEIDPNVIDETILDPEAEKILNELIDRQIRDKDSFKETFSTRGIMRTTYESLEILNHLNETHIAYLAPLDFRDYLVSIGGFSAEGVPSISKYYTQGPLGMGSAILQRSFARRNYLNKVALKDYGKYGAKQAPAQEAAQFAIGVAIHNALRSSTIEMMGRSGIAKFSPDDLGEGLVIEAVSRWVSNLTRYYSPTEKETIFKEITEILNELFERNSSFYGDEKMEYQCQLLGQIFLIADEQTSLDWKLTKESGDSSATVARRETYRFNPKKIIDRIRLRTFIISSLGRVVYEAGSMEDDRRYLSSDSQANLKPGNAYLTDLYGDFYHRLNSTRLVKDRVLEREYGGKRGGIPAVVMEAVCQFLQDKTLFTDEYLARAIDIWLEGKGLAIKRR